MTALQTQLLTYETDKLSTAINSFYSCDMMPIVKSIDEEMQEFMGDYWNIMRRQNKGKIAVQTVIVLWLAINDSKFPTLTIQGQNIIKWGCLLHAIAKLS